MPNPNVNLAREFRKKLIDNDSSISKFCIDHEIDSHKFCLALNGYDSFLKNYQSLIVTYLEFTEELTKQK
jgi:hypothetical protein